MTDTKRLAAAERKKEIMNSAAKVITERGLEKATIYLKGVYIIIMGA